MKRTCANAGCRKPTATKKNTYCSRRCYGESLRKNGLRKCMGCGKSFSRRHDESYKTFAKRKSCSMECRLAYMARERARKYRERITPEERARRAAERKYEAYWKLYGCPPYRHRGEHV